MVMLLGILAGFLSEFWNRINNTFWDIPFLTSACFYLKYYLHSFKIQIRDFPGGLVVKTSPSKAEGVGLIPGWGTKTTHAWNPNSKNIKQKQYCNRFNKDFKNGPYRNNLKKLINTKNLKCTDEKPLTPKKILISLFISYEYHMNIFIQKPRT